MNKPDNLTETMKKLIKDPLVATKMESAAEARTKESAFKATDKLLSNWIDHLKSNCDFDDSEDGDAQFDVENESERLQREILVALHERCHDFEVGYCRQFEDAFRKQLSVFLTFSFNYQFNEFIWNHNKSDPSNDDAFVIFESTDSLYPYMNWQHAIADTFKEYLTKAAALAKKIDSSSYSLWRDALVEVVFDHSSFENGIGDKSLNRIFDKITAATRILWADVRINNQLAKLSPSLSGYKRKNAKKQ